MKTLIASVIAAATIAASLPAHAQDMKHDTTQAKGFYVGAGAGVSLPQDSDITGTGINTTADFDLGPAVNAALGHAYGNGWRTEIELGYRTNDVDSLTGATSATGDASALSLMFNGLYDFQTGSAWSPYLGLGLGGARVKADGASPIGGSRIDDTDNVLAYQGIAGLSYKLSDAMSLFADYRYFATADPDFTTDSGTSVDSEYATHQVMLGLRWSFGAPKKPMMAEPKPVAAPKPMPAPVRAAPPPPPAPVIPRNYIVFFDWDQTTLRPDAQEILRTAAANYPKVTVISIDTTGHADRSGTTQYNTGLSQRRAQAVRAELARLGVPAGEINVAWKGEAEPLVPTADGVREPQNRRVEITFK